VFNFIKSSIKLLISLIKLIQSLIKSISLLILSISIKIKSQIYKSIHISLQNFQFVLSWPKLQIILHSFSFSSFFFWWIYVVKNWIMIVWVVHYGRILTNSHLKALSHHRHTLEHGWVFSQLRLEIVRDKCWDLFNNIGLVYRSLNMQLIFYFSLKVEQMSVWNSMNVLNYAKIDKKNVITMHV
jgi:hypothetical protein